MGLIKREAFLLEQPAGVVSFFDAFLRKIDVGPAGEPVFLVPDTFTMTQQYDLFHGTM